VHNDVVWLHKDKKKIVKTLKSK